MLILCVFVRLLSSNEWDTRVLSLITFWLHLLLSLLTCTRTHARPQTESGGKKGYSSSLVFLHSHRAFWAETHLSPEWTPYEVRRSGWKQEVIFCEAFGFFFLRNGSDLSSWTFVRPEELVGETVVASDDLEDSWNSRGAPFAACFQRWRTSEKLKLPSYFHLHPPGPQWVQMFVTWTPCCPQSRRAPAPAAQPCLSVQPLSGLLSWTSTLLPHLTPPWPHRTPSSNRNPVGGPPVTHTTLTPTPTVASAPSLCTSRDSSQAPELAGMEQHSEHPLLHPQLPASLHLWQHHTTISPPAGCSVTHHIWPTAWTLSRRLATRQVCMQEGGRPPIWNWWNTSIPPFLTPSFSQFSLMWKSGI